MDRRFSRQKALEILNDEKLISYLTDRIYVLQGKENPRIPTAGK